MTMHNTIILLTALSLSLGAAPVLANDARYAVRNSGNLAFRANELFRAFEGSHHPRMGLLRERYQLDRVVQAEGDEFKRIMLLRNWIHESMPMDDRIPTPTTEDAFDILDAAMAGGRFDCTQFLTVQNAILSSFGFITRTLGVGPGKNETAIGGHHGTNEVWVNSLGKWVMVDAQYDLHFEKNGIPLSALEIRDEVWKNNARNVKAAFGLERRPSTPQILSGEWGIWATAQNYRWVSWSLDTNNFTAHPGNAASSVVIMYDDKIFKKHKWQRDGKPHWSYGTAYLLKVDRREWIYWTPNTIDAKVVVDADRVRVELKSFTPNFRTYQVKVDHQPWRDTSREFELRAVSDRHRLVFRSVNQFGVTGPEYRIQLYRTN